MIASALDAARTRDGRARDFVGEGEFYCKSESCPIREITILIKEYDSELAGRLLCPACRSQLKLHGVMTLAEFHRAHEREARMSVRSQLYVAREIQRLGDPDTLVPVPISVFLDDALPRRAECLS